MAVKTIGEQLREARTARELTQEQAAERIGVSATAYRNWERNRKSVGKPNLAGVEEILGVRLIPQILDLPRLIEVMHFIVGQYQAKGWVHRRLPVSQIPDDIVDLYLESIDDKADFEKLKAEHAKIVDLQLRRLGRR